MRKVLYKSSPGCDCSVPDNCVPGKSTSISDIIARFVFDPNAVAKSGAMYDDSDDYEDDEMRDPSFDFADAHRLMQRIKEEQQNNIVVADSLSAADVSAVTVEPNNANQTQKGSSSEGSQSAQIEES